MINLNGSSIPFLDIEVGNGNGRGNTVYLNGGL